MLAHAIFSLILGALAPELTSQNYNLWVEQLKSPSPDLRINALLKISELKQPDSIAKMSELLTDSNSEVRFMAIRMVGKTQNPDALNFLKERLDSEKDPYLLSEIKRNIKGIEDYVKDQEKQKEIEKQRAEDKAARKLKKPAASPTPSRKR